MELRQLEYFVAVAEEQHFTRAAQRLNVAQSGLSATIKALETELGAQLFTRTTRRVQLTEAGQALLAEARHTLASARAATDAVSAVQGLERGSLTVGLMQAIGFMDLAGLLASFHRRYPGIDLHLRQRSSAEHVEAVADGRLDLAFTSGIGLEREGLAFIPVFSSPFVVVCAVGDPFAGEPAISLERLSGREFVDFPAGWGSRMIADEAFRAASLNRQVQFEVNDVTAALDLVEAGLGISLMPEAIVSGRPSLRCVRLEGAEPYWTILLTSVAPQPVNPAARALWEMARSTWPAARLAPPAPASHGVRATATGAGSADLRPHPT